MDDGSKLEYKPGRGIPCYLLDRIEDESSSYSDGASRIFVTTDTCSTSDKDTDTSDTSNTFSNSSLFDLSTAGSMSGILAISNQDSLQHESNISMSSVGAELCESTITLSDAALSSSNRSLVNTIQEQPLEIVTASNVSLMDTCCSFPMCLTKDNSQDEYIMFDEHLNSNDPIEPEKILPGHEDVSHYEKDIKDSSDSLLHWNSQYV